MKNKKKAIIFGAFVASFCVLTAFSSSLKSSLDSQNMAKRWSADGSEFAQISVFYPDSATYSYSEREAESLHDSIEQKMEEESYKSKNEESHIFNDAYSSVISNMNVNTKEGVGHTSSEIGIVGIGGDFFEFHPLELLSGNYIYSEELANNRVVLDEDAAWKLFASTDIIGMKIYINDAELEVAGVVRHEKGKAVENSYPEKSLIYAHYSLLETAGCSTALSSYEAVLPNPVDNYAKNIFLNHYGVDTTTAVEGEDDPEKSLPFVIVDNTKRYSVSNLWKSLLSFGKGSAVTRPIAFPYWENAARIVNAWLTLLFLFTVLVVAYIIITVIVFVAKLYLNRKWHLKPFIEKLTDKYTYKKRTRDYINVDMNLIDGKESRYE
ncbi:MAG: ABC transporter permease [Oscillospiraceae bacterium]|nr:ABC transporter permease [Oscillospiraceae bacterium]